MDAVFYQFFRNAVHNEFSFPFACSTGIPHCFLKGIIQKKFSQKNGTSQEEVIVVVFMRAHTNWQAVALSDGKLNSLWTAFRKN